MGITHNCQYGYYPYYIIYLGDKMFERIRDLREDNDLKQKDLASYLSVDQSTYSDYENGRINVPVDMLIKIADIIMYRLIILLEEATQRNLWIEYNT